MSATPRSPPKAEGQDIFRVSPWIPYDPSPDARSESLVRSNVHFYPGTMNEDVEMDAPQISTLREEETPEPQPTRTKFRVKLLVNEQKRSGSLASGGSHRPAQGGSEDEEDDEDEEDQLIDDDDDVQPAPSVPVVVPVASTARGSPAKRGRGRGGRRKGAGRGDAGPLQAAASSQLGELLDVTVAGTSATLISAPVGKKKAAAAAKGTGTQKTVRKRPSKATKAIAALQREDAESIISERTAASSPIPHDDRTPEPDVATSALVLPMALEDGSLEGVPLPVYPLPSKPFPVQPPLKIGTGFAPVVPLDKSGKPVRRWRQVNREIRGIAGGRWFTRTWAGEKESEYATTHAVASQAIAQAAADREAASAAALTAAGITLPSKLASISNTAATTSGKLKKSKAGLTTSAVPSRGDSAVSESISTSLSKRSNLQSSVSEEAITSSAP